MKKVLFVIPYLYGGGAEKVLSTVTTNFPKEYDIDILANSDSKIGYEYRGNIISLGMDRPENVMSVWFQFKVFLKRIKKLRQLKKTGEYLACYSFMDSSNVANILSGKKKCKTILSVHASLVSSERFPQYKYIVNPLVRILYNRADRIIAVSEGIRQELINTFKLKKDNIFSIINGCDKQDIEVKMAEELPADYRELFEKKVVLTVGRLSDQKAHWHLIRAFSEVVKKEDAILAIIGVGNLEDYLKDVAIKAGVKDRVVFLGYQSNPYVFMKHAKTFVLSSMFEGFPCSMAEAMCVGTPCVATSFETGSKELICPDYGVLSPLCSGTKYIGDEALEDAEMKLAEAILSVISSEDSVEHYKLKSIEKSQELGVEEMIQKWVKLLD